MSIHSIDKDTFRMALQNVGRGDMFRTGAYVGFMAKNYCPDSEIFLEQE